MVVKAASKLIIALIYAYKWLISPLMGKACRFEPTCSRYAINAIEFHGLIKGLIMTAKRILRCQPYETVSQKMESWGPSFGYDPVHDPKYSQGNEEQNKV